jgi:serine/threonine-protein kinase
MGGHELLQAWLLNDIGAVHHLRGDEGSAVRDMEAALALKEKVLGREHPDVGLSDANLAIFLHGFGRDEEALFHADRAIAMLEKGLGPGHPQIAASLTNRGEILIALQRYREARVSFESAERIWERELGPDNLNLGFALTGIGLSYLAEGNPALSLIPLERAFKIRQDHEPEASRRAETAFALAQALSSSNRGRCRARVLAGQALDDYGKAGSAAKAEGVEGWIRQHKSAWAACPGIGDGMDMAVAF